MGASHRMQPEGQILSGGYRDDLIEQAEQAAPRTIWLDREDEPSTGAVVTPQGEVHAPERNEVLRRYRSFSLVLLASDIFCLVTALLLSYVIRFGPRPIPGDYVLVLAFASLLWGPVFQGFRLYAPQHLSAWEEFRRVISGASIGIMLVVLGSYWSKQYFPRSWIALTWLFVVVFELASRRFWRWYAWRLRRDGHLVLRTLIVGTNAEAANLGRALRGKSAGFAPVGFVATSGPLVSPDGLPLVGSIEDLDALIREHAADCVFVASTAAGAQDMLSVVRATRQAGIEVRVSANLPEILTSRLSLQPVGDVMSVSLKPVRLTGPQAVVKRAFDLSVSSVGLLLSAPALGVIALAIRVTSPGPVFFKQRRVTGGGHVFLMYKFRTMAQDADRLLRERSIDPSTPFFKMQDDPRLTRVGRVLRRFSLDELPQLINVWRGEMSLVGPRPLPEDQVVANLETLAARHEVRAGITGWWQINGRSDVDPDEALRLDLFYIENWSLTLDLYVLLKTFGAVVARRGAY